MAILALGPFRLDTRGELLLLGDQPVALGRRAVAVLRVLIERTSTFTYKDKAMDVRQIARELGVRYVMLATMMCVVGNWEDSVGEARKALGLNPNSAFVISMLGLVLGRAGYHEEAIRHLRPAMRASPHDPLTWQWLNGIGDFQLFSGRFEAALESYREVTLLRPQFLRRTCFPLPRWPIPGGGTTRMMRWRSLAQSSLSRLIAVGSGHPGPVRTIGRSRRKASSSRLKDRAEPGGVACSSKSG